MRGVMRAAVLRFSQRSRQKKAAAISEFVRRTGARTSGLVGVGGGANPNEQIIERSVSDRTDVLFALDLWSASMTPGPYVMADARHMPFRDGICDVLLCNAVIEHVGGEADQRALVQEHCRVARAWVITTPNRWFPVEAHTAALFRHWSRTWRDGRREFTRLLSLREFKDLLPPGTQVRGRPWSATFSAYWTAAN